MLELPVALAPASAPNPAVTAAARTADKEGAGFQVRLREALDGSGAERSAPSNPVPPDFAAGLA